MVGVDRKSDRAGGYPLRDKETGRKGRKEEGQEDKRKETNLEHHERTEWRDPF